MKKLLMVSVLLLSGCVIADPFYAQYPPPIYAPVYVPNLPVATYVNPVYNYNVNAGVTCAYPYSPIYTTSYTMDRYGNRIIREKFVGCR